MTAIARMTGTDICYKGLVVSLRLMCSLSRAIHYASTLEKAALKNKGYIEHKYGLNSKYLFPSKVK